MRTKSPPGRAQSADGIRKRVEPGEDGTARFGSINFLQNNNLSAILACKQHQLSPITSTNIRLLNNWTGELTNYLKMTGDERLLICYGYISTIRSIDTSYRDFGGKYRSSQPVTLTFYCL